MTALRAAPGAKPSSRHRRPVRVVAALALVLGGFGCGPGRDYKHPDAPLPAAFSEAGPSTATGALAPALLDAAWSRFNDPVLLHLLARSEQSLAVRAAMARLDEAKALLRASTGELGPQLDAAGSVNRSRTTENGINPQGGRTETTWKIGADLSWEIDLFGGLRRSREASVAYLDSNVEAVRDVRLSWQAELVSAYLDFRYAYATAHAIREQADTLAATARLLRSRAAAQTGSERGALRAEAAAFSASAAMINAAARSRAAVHRLALLMATDAASLTRELGPSATTALPLPPLTLPAGLPSDLLLRRPDLRKAERDVAYATARIGVAEADLYPRFFLTGSAGLESIDLDTLMESGSRFWSIGPNLRWSLFSFGRVQATAKAAEARERQALVTYEQVVRTAMFECETALLRVNAASRAYHANQAATTAAQQAWNQAQRRLDAGIGTSDEALDAQRDYLAALLNAYSSGQAVAQANVDLTKAIGGGFRDPQNQ